MNSDILFFFGEHIDALPMYEKLEEQILAQIPDVKIKVAKTQITFANKRGFAFVSFNPCRKAAQRPKTWMTISFGFHKKYLQFVCVYYSAGCDATQIKSL